MTLARRLALVALGGGLLLLAPDRSFATEPGAAPAASAASDEAAERQRWHQRAVEARQRVSDAEAKLADAEAAVTHMRARRYPRGEAAAAREADVESAKKELADAQKAQADLEDEARRAGVPPGWIRLDDAE
jgi:hypothetical protein